MKKVLLALWIVGMFVMPMVPINGNSNKKDTAPIEKIWIPPQPILLIGKNNKFLSSIAEMSDVTFYNGSKMFNFSAIFIDSVWREKLSTEEMKSIDVFIERSIEKGIPVVAFGEKSAFLSNLLLGMRRETDFGVSVPLFNVTINAYIYLPTLGVDIQQFGSDNLDKHAISIARDLLEWIKNIHDSELNNKERPKGTLGPSWQWKHEWGWYSYDSWQPKGKFNIWCDAYKLINDGSYFYNWYDIQLHIQTIGGYSAYNSNWRTADTWTHHNLGTNPTDYLQHVIDYAPTTTSGASSVSVSVGVTAGEEGAEVTAYKTWSYSISDVSVVDESDESQELVAWWHNINEKRV